MPRTFVTFAVAAAALALVSSAEAASPKLWSLCSGADLDAAITACGKIIAGKATTKDRANAFLYRAYAYANKGDYDRAIADATRAIEIDAKNPVTFSVRGSAFKDKGDYDRAIADHSRAIELDPAPVIHYGNRGRTYLDKGDYANAIADFSRVLEIDPTRTASWNNRGFAYEKTGDLDRAIADYSRALELGPNADTFRNRAAAFQARGDHDRAIVDLTRVIELAPNNADAYQARGVSYVGKKDYDRAIADLTRAVDLDPKFAAAFSNRGVAYGLKGDLERALADQTRAIELVPDKPTLFYNRGSVYRDKGERERAIADFTRAIALNPNYPEAITALAKLKEAEVKAGQQPSAQSAHPQQTAAGEHAATAPTTSAAATAPAAPGKRVALVIGNSAYKNTTPLANPANDASDMAAALKRLGFSVIEETDLDKRGMDDAFRRFAREMADADAAMFYYAGHAMEWQGANYLMPVDAKLEDEADVPYEMAKLNDMLADMSRVKTVRIAVLDSCRDNPLENKLKRSIALTRGGTQTRGLARIERADGLVVAYSTSSGNVAADGSGTRNSPFTKALLDFIETPGLEVGVLFRRVMGKVKQATDGKQHPELSILLDSEFYFKP